MQHGSLRAPVRVFMAAVLLCLSFLAAPKAAAAQPADRLHRQPVLGPVQLVRPALRPHYSGWQALLRQRDVVKRRGMVCRRVLRLQRLPFRLPFPPV